MTKIIIQTHCFPDFLGWFPSTRGEYSCRFWTGDDSGLMMTSPGSQGVILSHQGHSHFEDLLLGGLSADTSGTAEASLDGGDTSGYRLG